MFQKQIPYVFLIIIYSVGLVGISLTAWRDVVLPLTPLNLLLTLAVLLFQNRPISARTTALLALIFSIGFFVEVAGVATGILFGVYEYGETLGYKFFDVPLVIGINWLFLSICSHAIANRFTKKPLILIPVASALMVALDVLVEPIAIQLDFWHWAGGEIPIQNYVMWFLTALIIHTLMYFSRITWRFSPAIFVFSLQVVFFAVLNLVL